MDKIILKPCPFCGGAARVIFEDATGFAVACSKCDAKASGGTVSCAAKTWNKRDGHNTTYIERLNELFPEAITEEVVNALCVCQIFGEEHDPPDCEELSCADCWDREMP